MTRQIQKIILTNLLILFSCFCYSQRLVLPIDSTSKEVTYKSVVTNSNNINKSRLYFVGLNWIKENITTIDSNSIADTIPKDSKEIIGVIKFPNLACDSFEYQDRFVSFDLVIYFKDSKIKYVFTNFIFHCLRVYNNELADKLPYLFPIEDINKNSVIIKDAEYDSIGIKMNQLVKSLHSTIRLAKAD